MTLPLSVASEIKHVLGLTLYNPFGSKYIIYESHDKDKLDCIIKNWKELRPQLRDSLFSEDKTHPLEILEEFQMLYPDGKGIIKYEFFNENTGIGRLMSTNDICLQNLYREARNYITGDIYDDVDMVNAQPTLLRWVCKKLDIDHVHLDKYIINREEILSEISNLNGISREDAKMLVIFMMNRGFHVYQRLKNKTQWMTDFYMEIQQIQERMHYHFPKTFDEIQKIQLLQEGVSNQLGSLLSTVMMTVENYVLLTIIQIFKDEGHTVNNAVLMFDGVLLPKHENNQATIEKAKEILKEKYDMIIDVKIKPIEVSLDVPEEMLRGGFVPNPSTKKDISKKLNTIQI